jgi:hypothetical protein
VAGDRAADPYSTPGGDRLAPLMAELRRLGAEAVPVLYQDDAPGSVRGQLLGLDGVLVWVNPIQDGANRSRLDALLREAAARGVWVSAHPDVILALGTTEAAINAQEPPIVVPMPEFTQQRRLSRTDHWRPP